MRRAGIVHRDVQPLPGFRVRVGSHVHELRAALQKLPGRRAGLEAEFGDTPVKLFEKRGQLIPIHGEFYPPREPPDFAAADHEGRDLREHEAHEHESETHQAEFVLNRHAVCGTGARLRRSESAARQDQIAAPPVKPCLQ